MSEERSGYEEWNRARYVKMARWSWLCPAIAWGLQIGITMVSFGVRGAPEAIGAIRYGTLALAELVLLIAGLLLGMRALRGTREHGRDGIFAPAIAGIRVPAIMGIAISGGTFLLIFLALAAELIMARIG